MSDFHWAQSKPGAGGTNAVNTIIVDFRGFDTYGEIIVLGIAALVIFALAVSVLSSRTALDRLANTEPHGIDAGDPHPLMLVMGTRFLMPLALMVGRLHLPARPQPAGRRLCRRAGRVDRPSAAIHRLGLSLERAAPAL